MDVPPDPTSSRRGGAGDGEPSSRAARLGGSARVSRPATTTGGIKASDDDRRWVASVRAMMGKVACRAAVEEARREDRLTEEEAAVGRWVATGDPEAAAYNSRLGSERREMRRRETKERRLSDEQWSEPDREAVWAGNARSNWIRAYAGLHGSYEDTTAIPATRSTDEAPGLYSRQALQMISVRVRGTRGGLHWPLDVYGLIAVRDAVDRNRNVIFARARDNCQTITAEDPYIELTGPTRAIVVVDPLYFEIVLKVKGTNESEDKDLSFLVVSYDNYGTNRSCVINRINTSKLSTLELTFCHLTSSVEATISMQVVHGSWPEGSRGVFSASTGSLPELKITLLALEGDKLPVTADGMIQLSRRVVMVEQEGELNVSIVAKLGVREQAFVRTENVFIPQKAGRSCCTLIVGTYEMKVVVAWSLIKEDYRV